MANIANKIEAKDKSLYSIFSENRYRIDVFQREYRWQSKHIEALVDDLTASFLTQYIDSHTIEDVEGYDSYYMGPIVLCKDGAECSIVDGQQRLTSFALLMVYLQHQQEEVGVNENLQRDLREQLYIKRGGKQTFILNVKERTEIMEQLLEGNLSSYDILQTVGVDANYESLENLLGRYDDIGRCFPSEIMTPQTLPLFIEWLLFKVVFVEVKAYSIENAYTIFETMNDRGLSLNPTEILKALILSKIDDEERSEEMNNFWKEKIANIKYKTSSDGDLAFFRSWFRAKYAITISNRQQGASKEDFEEIGSQFHSWFKNNIKKVGLKSSMDYYYFVKNNFDFFANAFLIIQQHISTESLESYKDLYVTNCFSLADSLYWPLMMSPLSVYDSESTIQEKFIAVNNFVDCYINRRQLSFKSINQSSVRNYIYELVKKIRDLDVKTLISVLDDEKVKLLATECVISSSQSYSQSYLHYFYARILLEIYPEKRFQSFLRTRKQTSYVLLQIFSHEECQQAELLSNTYPSWGITNYCLIRRNDVNSIPASLQERIDWLREKGYLPEVNDFDSVTVSNFMERRYNVIYKLVDKIWSI